MKRTTIAILGTTIGILVISGLIVIATQELAQTTTTATSSSSLETTTSSSSYSSSSTIFSSSSSSIFSTSTTSSSASDPIKHLIVIMQENRAFDNYFWSWPGQIGYIPNFCMPNNPSKPGAGCKSPQLVTDPALATDLPHTWASSWQSFNNGSMNGFLAAANDNSEVMDYYNNETIPNLWSYAQHYVLGDEFFTSVKSYSQPNHWYMIAANSPVISLTTANAAQEASCYNSVTKVVTLSTCTYINEAQQISTMADELTKYGITWKYYDTPPPSSTLDGAILNKAAFDYWNPLNARNTTYTNSTIHSNLVPRVDILWDIGNGTLPSVSWVIPSAPISDHPPANIQYGMWWVTDIVNSVMKSQYWNNTAIVVLWDDYGGFFDTIVPPTVDSVGLSFRCPALIISAYAKAGYLDHTVFSFESTLKFIEWTWNIPPLTTRDAFANNLVEAFNFHETPLPRTSFH